MATLRIKYTSKTCLPSCLAGEQEVQVGEQVVMTLKPKSALWPEQIKAFLSLPVATEHGERVYYFDFDDEQLNGGATPDSCDLGVPTCWSCCDTNAEKIQNLVSVLVEAGVIIQNEDGTCSPVPVEDPEIT